MGGFSVAGQGPIPSTSSTSKGWNTCSRRNLLVHAGMGTTIRGLKPLRGPPLRSNAVARSSAPGWRPPARRTPPLRSVAAHSTTEGKEMGDDSPRRAVAELAKKESFVGLVIISAVLKGWRSLGMQSSCCATCFVCCGMESSHAPCVVAGGACGQPHKSTHVHRCQSLHLIIDPS